MPTLVFEFYGKGVCVNGEFYFINAGEVVEVGRGDHVSCLPNYWITMRFIGLVLANVSQDLYPDRDQMIDIDDLTQKLAYKEIVDNCVFLVDDDSEIDDYGEEVSEDLGCDFDSAIVPADYTLGCVERVIKRLSTRIPEPRELIVSQSQGLVLMELGGLPSHELSRLTDTSPYRTAMYNSANKKGFVEIIIAMKYKYKGQLYLVSNASVFCGEWANQYSNHKNMKKHFLVGGQRYWDQRYTRTAISMFWARAVVRFRRYQSDQKLLIRKGIEPNPGPQVPIEVILQTLLMIIIVMSAILIYVLHRFRVL